MRFRTHLLTSAAAGLLLYPSRPARLAALVAAGTLIDVDHLVLYALQTGDWSVIGALRYDRYRHRGRGVGDTRPRYGSLRSWLHDPRFALPAVWTLAATRPALRPLALGLSLHLLLDHLDWPWRYMAVLRAGGVCQVCRRRGMRLVVHRSGRRGRYMYQALCRACGDRAVSGRQTSSNPSGHLHAAQALWYTDSMGGGLPPARKPGGG